VYAELARIAVQVWMNDFPVVRAREAFGDLASVVHGFFQTKRTMLEVFSQGPSFHVLHHGDAVVPDVEKVVDGHDVRVRERREHLRFSLEAGENVRIRLPAQDFQCDPPMERGIPGTIDMRHPSPSDLPQNLVFAEKATALERGNRGQSERCGWSQGHSIPPRHVSACAANREGIADRASSPRGRDSTKAVSIALLWVSLDKTAEIKDFRPCKLRESDSGLQSAEEKIGTVGHPVERRGL
jgi:hypothetical protein